MQPFTKREKILLSIIVCLALLSGFLLYSKTVCNNESSETIISESDFYADRKSDEETILDSSIIFICIPVIEQKIVKYKVNKIIYKDKDYVFPYFIGDYYPRIECKKEKGFYYKNERLVILSKKSPDVLRNFLIMDGGIIPLFDNLPLNEFIQTVNKLKEQKS